MTPLALRMATWKNDVMFGYELALKDIKELMQVWLDTTPSGDLSFAFYELQKDIERAEKLTKANDNEGLLYLNKLTENMKNIEGDKDGVE